MRRYPGLWIPAYLAGILVGKAGLSVGGVTVVGCVVALEYLGLDRFFSWILVSFVRLFSLAGERTHARTSNLFCFDLDGTFSTQAANKPLL